MSELIDSLGRRIEYLRLSVTDRCNYRCTYCKPAAFAYEPRENILNSTDLTRLLAIFSRLGVRKVRLTGGEPLMRRNLPKLAHSIATLPGIEELSLSTNGALLGRHAEALRDAGVRRVNVSLDTLDPERFHKLTQIGHLDAVLKGLEIAQQTGLTPVKLNMVVMAGINDDEIEAMVDFALARNFHLRFIETMPIGEQGAATMQRLYPTEKILERVQAHCGADLVPISGRLGAGPARNYRIGGGTIGVISALSRHFCADCNRVRLTARGDLVLCLGREASIPLGDQLRAGADDATLEASIRAGILTKPAGHNFESGKTGGVPMSVTGG